ncbi:MAG: hypothetical protein LBD41_05090 [Clostridiales Family XIII bacterium]|jgi:hypothetical protein|nr:hypothetical protein [Clostridiales Family XIII bacterium]
MISKVDKFLKISIAYGLDLAIVRDKMATKIKMKKANRKETIIENTTAYFTQTLCVY